MKAVNRVTDTVYTEQPAGISGLCYDVREVLYVDI